MAKKISKSKAVALKTLEVAVQILLENEGEMRGSDIIAEIPNRVEFTEWELGRYEKTGYIRWQSILHFYTIDLSKAGYLQKEKGVWTLTDEGEEAFGQGMADMLDTAIKKYREWKQNQQVDNEDEDLPTEGPEEPSQKQEALLQQYEEKAIDGILAYIKSLNPYQFQDLCATLLKGMGYYIPHVAKRGKDGGIDIIAYSDPLGTKMPRIKVQVKHRPDDAVSVDAVRQLVALLNKEGDVGLFVTSGRYTSESERYARESHKHIELIDFERFLTLWQEFYPKMTDEQKDQLPLQPVYFLGLVGG